MAKRRPRYVGQADADDVERVSGAVGDPEEENKARKGSRGNTREGGAGRGIRGKARPGILLCALLGVKGPRGKVQSKSRQWYDVHADMSRRDNIPEGAGRGTSAGDAPKRRGRYRGRSRE